MTRIAFLLPSLALLSPAPALGQLLTEPLQEMEARADSTHDEEKKKGKEEKDENEKKADDTDFLIVPIPQSSPTLGAGATLVGVLFYNPAKEPSPWVTGVGIMRTSNGSKAIGALHRMSLWNDKFRLVLFGGHAQININFYGIGPDAGQRDLSIELEEKGNLAAGQAQYRLVPHFYAGLRGIFLDLNTSIHNPEPLFPELELPEIEFKTKMIALGPSLSWDRRDNLFTPHNGELITAAWMFSRPDLGSDFDYDKLTVAANVYRQIGKKSVIAGRVSICGASRGGPFYDLCLYGSQSDLRGYETGRYRDRASWAAQVEFRQHLFGRFGAVAFAGMGGIAPQLSDLGDTTFLPAAGVGVRYQPSKQTPINLRVDVAVGRNSHALYISLGEAF